MKRSRNPMTEDARLDDAYLAVFSGYLAMTTSLTLARYALSRVSYPESLLLPLFVLVTLAMNAAWLMSRTKKVRSVRAALEPKPMPCQALNTPANYV